METFDRTTNNEEVDVVAEQVAEDVAQNANSVPFPGVAQESVRTAPELSKQQESVPDEVSGEVVEDDDSIPDFMKG